VRKGEAAALWLKATEGSVADKRQPKAGAC
jgi:hypothetical protein